MYTSRLGTACTGFPGSQRIQACSSILTCRHASTLLKLLIQLLNSLKPTSRIGKLQDIPSQYMQSLSCSGLQLTHGRAALSPQYPDSYT